MDAPTILTGDGGDHIAIVHIRDISQGHKMIFSFDVETGEGYYDPVIDNFGDEVICIIDQICFEQAEAIFERIGQRTFYRGYETVVEDNRQIALGIIRSILEENPYEL